MSVMTHLFRSFLKECHITFLTLSLQFTGDDCWIGKQQQDIYCQCAWTAGATGEMIDEHAENIEKCSSCYQHLV